jgi:hypothetical protein
MCISEESHNVMLTKISMKYTVQHNFIVRFSHFLAHSGIDKTEVKNFKNFV